MPSNNRISAREICNEIRTGTYFNLDLNGISQNVIDSAVYDLNISSNGTITPLHYAALKGRFDIVADLMSRGADPSKIVNHQNLYGRLWYKDKPKFLHLLNHFFGENSNKIVNIEEIRNKITASVNAGFTDGSTLLIQAIKHGRQDLVNALIKAGADVNKTNHYNGITALDIAISHNKQAIAKLLLKQEEIQVPNKNNILHKAIKNNLALDIIKELINKGANIEFPDNDGNTPLLLAAKEGRVDIIKLLITYKVDNEALDDKNMNWEKAYRKKRMIPAYRALIVTLAVLTYAIIGAICTNNLFHSFKHSVWNISIIVASVVGVISLILTRRYLVGARDDCDVFIPEIKKLIQEQACNKQRIIVQPQSAPLLEQDEQPGLNIS